MELKASQAFDFNLGIKQIRGAYMDEERMIAKNAGSESPVWDTIEDTHTCYNNNIRLLLKEMKSTDRIFFGSHNVKSVELLKTLLSGECLDKKPYIKIG